MSQDSRIRNRQLRAYGVFAIAIILLVIIVIAVIGLFPKDTPSDSGNTPSDMTSSSATATATPTLPPVTPPPSDEPSQVVTPTPVQPSQMVVKTSSGSGVNMRAKASTESNIVTHLDDGQVLTVIEAGDEWTQVKTSDNKEGFVKNNFLINKVTATVVNINSSLNVRATASAKGKKVGSLEKGEVIIVLDASDAEWTKIVFSKNKIGYCKSEYLQVAE